jgi:hypothetical protein
MFLSISSDWISRVVFLSFVLLLSPLSTQVNGILLIEVQCADEKTAVY